MRGKELANFKFICHIVKDLETEDEIRRAINENLEYEEIVALKEYLVKASKNKEEFRKMTEIAKEILNDAYKLAYIWNALVDLSQ
ncbi:MAG: hypothetical protein ABIL45_04160 [candidate division WOR-3 bacterium]